MKEFYGSLAWSVRAYFAGTLGWFDGNPTNLFPTPPDEKAKMMAELAGGEDALFVKMNKAAEAGKHQWAMELADLLIRIGTHGKEAKSVKARALRALGDQQINACARNYYLSYAKELMTKSEKKK